MNNKIFNILENFDKWWIYWGVLTPIFTFFGFVSMFLVSSYTFLLFEFLPSAFFGLYIYDNQNFFKNFKKLLIIFIVLTALIFIFKMEFVWLSILIMLFLLSFLKFEKEEFLWSFGSMMLYVLLSFVPLFILFFLTPATSQNYQEWGLIVSNYVILLIFGYFIKGTFFGLIMRRFYAKKRGYDVL